MKKIWYSLVVLSIGLIYFHQLEVEKANSPFISLMELDNTTLMDTIPLSTFQKENLDRYIISINNPNVP